MINKAPWTDAEVQSLSFWQAEGPEPFTCNGHDGCDRFKQPENGTLIPFNTEMVCPCGKYTCNWAHDFMCDIPPEDLPLGRLTIGGEPIVMDCPLCEGGIARYSIIIASVNYRAKDYTVHAHAYVCDTCGERYTNTVLDTRTLEQIPDSTWQELVNKQN